MSQDKKIQTLKGSVDIDSLVLILRHEHLFTDLRGPLVPDYARAEPEDGVRVAGPFLAEAFEASATALVECSTVGVGRNLGILKSLAEVSPIHNIAPTRVYRDAFIPSSLRETNGAVSEEQISRITVDNPARAFAF